MWEGVVQGGGGGRGKRQCEISEKAKKGEALKRPQLQRIAYLEAQIWTRWRVEVGASFCGRGLFREGVEEGARARQCEISKNSKKGEALNHP